MDYLKLHSARDILNTAVIIYLSAAALATGYGGITGAADWSRWMATRTYRPIALKTVEPIVNVAADAGQLAFMVGGSAIASGIVALTSPISVPVLLNFFSEPVAAVTAATADAPTGGAGVPAPATRR
jgi:hypothetical protein